MYHIIYFIQEKYILRGTWAIWCTSYRSILLLPIYTSSLKGKFSYHSNQTLHQPFLFKHPWAGCSRQPFVASCFIVLCSSSVWYNMIFKHYKAHQVWTPPPPASTSRVWDYTAYRSRHGNVMLMGGVHKRCSQNVISIPYLLCRYNFNDLVVTTFYADDPFPFQIGWFTFQHTMPLSDGCIYPVVCAGFFFCLVW